MFDALEMSLKVLERLAPVKIRIRRESASLARQLADASESVALNLGEGRLRRDGYKRRHVVRNLRQLRVTAGAGPEP